MFKLLNANGMAMKLATLRWDKAGATAIEYGLIAALVAVASITAMRGLGNQMRTTFHTTSSQMSSANAAA